MKNLHLRSSAVALLSAVMFCGTVSATSLETLDRPVVDAAKIARDRVGGPRAMASSCPNATPIFPPATIQGTMTTSSCIYIGSYDQVYSFNGTAGQTLTIDYQSTAFDVFLIVDGPSTHEYGQRRSYRTTSGVSRITLSYALPSSGQYTIEAMTLDDYDQFTYPVTGPYTLAVDLSGTSSSTCTATSSRLCLSNGRFAVSVNWRTNDSSGAGTAVPLTADTGYFWFFNSANVELVVKVLDARGVNNKFWVFYGALSNVEYTITVTDTEKNITKTYTNPQGKLASVADTSAFNP